jgi:hypothetical protein
MIYINQDGNAINIDEDNFCKIEITPQLYFVHVDQPAGNMVCSLLIEKCESDTEARHFVKWLIDECFNTNGLVDWEDFQTYVDSLDEEDEE